MNYIATPRRKYRLADTNHADIDFRNYSKVIIETIENIVPGKNPKVFKEYYSTDETAQSVSEAAMKTIKAVMVKTNETPKTVNLKLSIDAFNKAVSVDTDYDCLARCK